MSALVIIRPLLKGAAVFVRELLRELAEPEPAPGLSTPEPVKASRQRPGQRQQPDGRKAGR